MNKVRDSVLRYGELIENIIVQFESIIKAILKFDLPDQSVAAVEAVAVSLSSLFIAMEMISYFSTMRMEGRIEDALQLIIKLVLAKILLENTDAIMSGIYGEFNRLGFSAIETGLNAVREIMPGSIESIVDANKGMIGEGWILMSVALLIVSIVVTVMMISITMQIVGIIFEIAIHQAVGPIALSTLCNSTMRSTGLSFIKSYAAVCLQTTVIGVIFNVFGTLSGADFLKMDIKTSILWGSIQSTGSFGVIFMYLFPMLMLIILGVTVKKSGDITKRMFGA